MSEPGWLADQFEHWRPHLASVAYGMLGSVTEAEDAVQQAWLRLGRSDASPACAPPAPHPPPPPPPPVIIHHH